MFTLLHIEGLGPIDDLTIEPSPTGITEIAGPSEVGKSTLVEAVCLALWGTAGDGRPFPVEGIRDGHQRAMVEATTARGTVLRRGLTRSRIPTRELTVGEDVQVFTREEDLAARLGPVGQKADLGRLVVVPFSWVPLLQRELGRPLRDLLLSALPSGDLRAEVARLMGEHPLRQQDPLDAAGAARLQTAANRSRDEAQGRLTAAKSRSVQTAEPESVDAAEVAAARDMLSEAGAWASYDSELARFQQAEATRNAAQAAREDWRKRRAELGDRPTMDEAAYYAATEAVSRLAATVNDARRLHHQAAVRLAESESAVERVRTRYRDLQKAGDACPTCGRPGWEKAGDQLATAKSEGTRLRKESDAWRADTEACETEVKRAEDALATAKDELAGLERANEAPRAWDARLRALGSEPQIPPGVPSPRKPEMRRPTEEDLASARSVLRVATEAEGARKRAAIEAERSRGELVEATAAWERADREARRVEALVLACRRAPSEIARAQADALGDLGPVRIVFPEKETKQTPEVEVLVDGRPWWLASTGRQIVADLWLRAAIRRASGLLALPIVVDRAQDWSGGWPEVPGPVWFLRTSPDAFSVRSL